jgi:hypothetical protein
MYYPYFRGKQYDLITIRENAVRMTNANIIPIIEPVKRNLSSLSRTIEKLIEHNTRFTLIVNPIYGELRNDGAVLFEEIIDGLLADYDNCTIGYIISEDSALPDIQDFCAAQTKPVSIIHYGYAGGSRELGDALAGYDGITNHIFIEQFCSRLYRRHFRDSQRILIRDGFIHRTNREHPEGEHFSDLHITYTDEGVNGFGDFLIVGDDYMESGGPAYAVAIHITYLHRNEDNDMYLKHYVSDRTNSPVDPGGKFLEALQKLVNDVNAGDSMIFRSQAVQEYIALHEREHYPGLGYAKKLSMQHHIELIEHFLGA